MNFPPALYGTLQAFLALVSFLFGLLNYVLTPYAQVELHGDYTTVILLLWVPTTGLYLCLHLVREPLKSKVVDADTLVERRAEGGDHKPYPLDIE
jgi:hypothetical protein